MTHTGRTGAGRLARAIAAVLLVVVVVGVSSGCTPRLDSFRIVNDSTEPLLFEGRRIEPGSSARIEHDDGCRRVDELVTADLVLRVVVPEPLCDGDRLTVHDEDLVPLVDVATVRNASSADLLVTFVGGAADEQRVGPGERVRLALVDASAGCSDRRLFATVADQDDAPVVPHDGPICVGDEWVLDDATLAAGPAVVTVANLTDVVFEVSVWAPWSSDVGDVRVAPGARVEMDLGVAPDTCTEELEVEARTVGADDGDALRADGPVRLCDGDTWEITWDQVERHDPAGSGWAPARWATISVTNGTDAEIRVAVDDGDPVAVRPGYNGILEIAALAGECTSVRLTADVTGGARPQVASGLVEVCDGAQAVVTVDGIEVTSPDGPPWES